MVEINSEALWLKTLFCFQQDPKINEVMQMLQIVSWEKAFGNLWTLQPSSKRGNVLQSLAPNLIKHNWPN